MGGRSTARRSIAASTRSRFVMAAHDTTGSISGRARRAVAARAAVVRGSGTHEEESLMPELSRRAFVAGSAAAVTVRAPYVHAQKQTGTLRFVPHADLKILDPIWTTAYITRNHGYMIFDTLFALDADLKI